MEIVLLGSHAQEAAGEWTLEADFIALAIADEMLATRGVLSLVGAIL